MKVPLIGTDQFAILDDDFTGHLPYKLYLHNRGYAIAKRSINGKREEILLHRLVMGNPKGMEIDHKNGVRLDCRSENLRVVTRSQNHMNRASRPSKSTGIIGVRKDSKCNSWIASIKKNRVCISKSFKSLEEAVVQRKTWEIEMFGEFRPSPERLAVVPPPAVYPNRKASSRG